MLVVTTDNIPGYEVGLLGTVKGTNIDTIEEAVSWYSERETATQYFNKLGDVAVERAISEAEKLGADAIISLKYVYAEFRDKPIITAYGTAVALKISNNSI